MPLSPRPPDPQPGRRAARSTRGFRFALELCDDDDLIITLESDTTSDLDALEAMLAVARDGADVVLASHHADGGELVARAIPRFALARRLVGDPRDRRPRRQHRLLVLPRLPRRRCCATPTSATASAFIRERGFACKAEILIKLSRMGAGVAEVPVDLDWLAAHRREQAAVLPTMAGYTRLMTRQVATRMRASA